MARAIDALPKGTYRHEMRIDGYDEPIDLVTALTIGDGEILVDYEGTSSVSKFGINCPMCYNEAYTSFGVKCIVAPSLPNNAGTMAAIRVTAPENSIVNAPIRVPWWRDRISVICCPTPYSVACIRPSRAGCRQKGPLRFGTSPA